MDTMAMARHEALEAFKPFLIVTSRHANEFHEPHMRCIQQGQIDAS